MPPGAECAWARLDHIMLAYDSFPAPLRKIFANSCIRWNPIDLYQPHLVGAQLWQLMNLMNQANQKAHERLVAEGLTVEVDNLVPQRIRPKHPREARLERAIERRFSRWGTRRNARPFSAR
jgi:hypothetical protein